VPGNTCILCLLATFIRHSVVALGEKKKGKASLDFQEVDTFDDPNVISQKLMLLSLREYSFDIDFPINKLKQPYGEVATSILDYVTDKALECSDCKYEVTPKYITEEWIKNPNLEGNIQEDEMEEIVDTDDETFDDSHDSIDLGCETIITQYDNQISNPVNSVWSKSITTAKIDPVVWRAELERVSPLLGVDFAECEKDPSIGQSWRSQVNHAFVENETLLLEVEKCNDALRRLSKESNKALSIIQVKECLLNEKFRKVIEEYTMYCNELVDFEQKQIESSTTLSALNEECSNLSSKLEKIKAKVDEKSNRMTDTNPLIQIQKTLTEIRTEIREYDLQIGILEHNIVHRQLASKVHGKNISLIFKKRIYRIKNFQSLELHLYIFQIMFSKLWSLEWNTT
jgi:estrogen-related receptor beta like 1